MVPDENRVDQAVQEINDLRAKGTIADISSVNRYSYRLTVVGPPAEEVKRLNRFQSDVQITIQEENGYYFFGELRPGSGVLRRQGGRPDGPGGTLTCLLEPKRGSGSYFAAAGHVLSNFWRSVRPIESEPLKDLKGSIYLNRRGFPATNSHRFLGDLIALSSPPKRIEEPPTTKEISVDIGIVKLAGAFDLKQRTTCYGSFGEWLSDPVDVIKGQDVMKCGAEETHWTAAKVKEPSKTVWVYGPDRVRYRIANQVILELPHVTSQERVNAETGCPENPKETPFAVAGDSGTMVVDCRTKRPVGMLIAGSILDGEYVMTPISALWEFWDREELVLRRA